MELHLKSKHIALSFSVGILLSVALGMVGCGNGVSSQVCPKLSGSSWVPQIPGVSSANHTITQTLSRTTMSASGPIVGLGQAYSGQTVSFSIPMDSSLGTNGSLTLLAQTTQFPSGLSGSAFPVLVSLSVSGTEWVNLASPCSTQGIYTCSGSSCTPNPNCTINSTSTSPSVFQNFNHWSQYQMGNTTASGFPSVNIFPLCAETASQYSATSSSDFGSATYPSCPFNHFPNFTVPLPSSSGLSYNAQYVLVADSYASLTGYNAGIELQVTKKTDSGSTSNGAFDLNIVLVGSDVITASRTAKGQQNLNTLIASVNNVYNQTSTGVQLGTITPVEWTCEQGGDAYATVDSTQIGQMFAAGSTQVPSSTEGSAINVFLVNSLTDSSQGNQFELIGYDGGIGGPTLNGTQESGTTVTTFGALDTMNAQCSSTAATCPVTEQDTDFFTVAEAVSHEIGHYFGFNHLTEGTQSAGSWVNDFVVDTPLCTVSDSSGYLTNSSCATDNTNTFPWVGSTSCETNCLTYDPSAGSYCGSALQCEFNYTMWWTTKNFTPGAGTSDGILFSADQATVIRASSFVH